MKRGASITPVSDKGDEITYVLESPIMGRATAESVVHIVNELDVNPVIAVDGGDDVAKCVDYWSPVNGSSV